jgi:Tol biopolymer transport system component
VGDIVPGDTNDAFDVFVRDRKLGTTTRVSVDSAGTEAQGGGSFQPALSDDGQRVAFASEANNLVADDTNGVQDIFVHDLASGTTVRASVASDGAQADGQSNGPGIRGGSTFGPDISGDGRFVTFDSVATNLVPDDTNICSYDPGGQSFPEPGECPDVFVRDLQTATTTRVSVSSSGKQANDASTDPSISQDGQDVVFFSTAAFVADDTNTCAPFFFGHAGECPDIYLHHR